VMCYRFDCLACADNEFQCNNTNCIPVEWVCDGYDGCGDWSDELANCSEWSSLSF